MQRDGDTGIRTTQLETRKEELKASNSCTPCMQRSLIHQHSTAPTNPCPASAQQTQNPNFKHPRERFESHQHPHHKQHHHPLPAVNTRFAAPAPTPQTAPSAKTYTPARSPPSHTCTPESARFRIATAASHSLSDRP